MERKRRGKLVSRRGHSFGFLSSRKGRKTRPSNNSRYDESYVFAYTEQTKRGLGFGGNLRAEGDLGEVREISSLDRHAFSIHHTLVGDRAPARATTGSRDGIARIDLESYSGLSGGLD